MCYVLLVRQDGFLLCLPDGFFSEEELAPQETESAAGPGPFLRVSAPPVALSEEGEWRRVPNREPIAALVVDFPAPAAQLLSPLDGDLFIGRHFLDSDPSFYPLASDVLVQARQWILSEGAGLSSGYQTAASEPVQAAGPDPKRGSRPKRPTIAQLAQSQANLAELVARISEQLKELRQAPGRTEAAAAPAAQAGAPLPTQAARQAPLSAHLPALLPSDPQRQLERTPLPVPSPGPPPLLSVPKSLARVLGPPPPVQTFPLANQAGEAQQIDQDAQMAAALTSGELPDVRQQDDFSAAMMLQSKALLALVGQMSQGGDPVLDPSSSSTVSARGSQTRQRLQAELAQHTGSFAEKVKERAMARMAPAGVGSTEAFSLCRYHERFGGYAKSKEQGLIAWQVAIAFDLIMSGNTTGAADSLALLALYLDQMTLDGSPTVAWLLTLLQDPPQSLFSDSSAPPGINVQPFSHLADQKWITSAWGSLKEMDLISSRHQPNSEPPSGLPRRQHRPPAAARESRP